MNRIRLTEGQLRRIIKESVKKTLKEETDIELQEHVYKMLGGLKADIATVIMNTDSSSNQAFGGPEDKLKAIYNSMTHIGNDELAEDAKNTFTKLLEVLSELQDICIELKTFNADDKYWGHKWEPSRGTVGLSNYQ